MTKAEHELSFEKAFERLEHILEVLNSSHPDLEEALKLYEEADALILQCHKKLSGAEKKIELLMKNRNGQLQPGPDQKPLTQDMQPNL
ncbi:MAG: exodeoxyribonuclease VII small subunit [Verrucomicrobia bacterium]|nr:exodeoxyribonuclease VII small subunit [Verrucomicrobiota bacterium]